MEKINCLDAQIQYLTTMDKLKQILRRTSPIGLERRENSAEHSWQAVLTALMLAEHANEPIDLFRVVQMLAVHDTVEIEVGDTVHFFKNQREGLAELEDAAAQKIFSRLPSQQGEFYLALWREFDARVTPEAKFAGAIDRFVPFILNFNNQGGSWRALGITAEALLEATNSIEQGCKSLWKYAQTMVERCVELGYIKSERAISNASS